MWDWQDIPIAQMQTLWWSRAYIITYYFHSFGLHGVKSIWNTLLFEMGILIKWDFGKIYFLAELGGKLTHGWWGQLQAKKVWSDQSDRQLAEPAMCPFGSIANDVSKMVRLTNSWLGQSCIVWNTYPWYPF